MIDNTTYSREFRQDLQLTAREGGLCSRLQYLQGSNISVQRKSRTLLVRPDIEDAYRGAVSNKQLPLN